MTNEEKIAEKLKARSDAVENPDGTWSFEEDVNIPNEKLIKLPLRFGRVEGSFNCSGNELTSLEGAPSHVGMYFACSHNHLTSLEGAPSHIEGSFYCHYNDLTSLEGAPSYVKDHFFFNDWDTLKEIGNISPETFEKIKTKRNYEQWYKEWNDRRMKQDVFDLFESKFENEVRKVLQ